MPFNSETGRLAGQKSKRGQAALSSEIIDEINIKELTSSEKIEEELEQPLFHIEIIDKTE